MPPRCTPRAASRADEYVRLRNEEDEAGSAGATEIDGRMVAIVERMFERCYNDQAWTQAMGVALEARRLDKVKEVLERSETAAGAKASLLAYTLDVCVGKQQLLHSRDFRLQVLGVLVELHQAMPDGERDYASEVHCLQQLDNAAAAGETLKTLLSGTEAQHLLAYQLGFDIAESDHQAFILAVLIQLDPSAPGPLPPPTPAQAGDAMQTGAADGAAAEEGEAAAATPMDPALKERVDRLAGVLRASGFMVDLQLNFLHGQSKADPLLLLSVKEALEPRNATLHQATVAAHAFMYAGTANTSFVREHIEWVSHQRVTPPSAIICDARAHPDSCAPPPVYKTNS